MHQNLEEGKKNIITAINLTSENYKNRPNAAIFRVFFDAKSDEIMQILDGGPGMNVSATINTLNQIAPVHSRKWRRIGD